MIYIIGVLLILQILVLSIFVYQSIMQRNSSKNKQFFTKVILDKFDVIVAAKEDYDTINKCIKNVLSVGFENIIICIDGGNNDVFYRLKLSYPSLTILYNETSLGKIRSQNKCLSLSKKENILILDADIALLKEEVTGFVSYFWESNVDFLCPYSIGLYEGNNQLLYSIAETDRHMRQRVVRAGRDAYGVSNLSGYCMLAKRIKYIDIIDDDAIQDDVIATINLLKKKYTVKTYHKAVCSEIERSTFKSYLMQKTRWTAGNIVLIKSYKKLFEYTSLIKALAFTSSFLLWYWSLWIDFIALLLCIYYPPLLILLLIEGFIKYIGLVNACKPQKRTLDILMYIIIWPLISTICLVLSPYYLTGKIVEQKTRR